MAGSRPHDNRADCYDKEAHADDDCYLERRSGGDKHNRYDGRASREEGDRHDSLAIDVHDHVPSKARCRAEATETLFRATREDFMAVHPGSTVEPSAKSIEFALIKQVCLPAGTVRCPSFDIPHSGLASAAGSD